MNLDEDTLPAEYPAINKQGFHAIAWARENLGARMFYAAFGHSPESWSNPTVIEMTARAIEWAAHQR
jgi:type 1 glutamine amidotransferase